MLKAASVLCKYVLKCNFLGRKLYQEEGPGARKQITPFLKNYKILWKIKNNFINSFNGKVYFKNNISPGDAEWNVLYINKEILQESGVDRFFHRVLHIV